MRHNLRITCAVVLHFAALTAANAFEWQTAPPESQQLSGAKLDALGDELFRLGTRAFLVIRNDRIVYERYSEGNGPAKPQGTASLAKALVGGMSLAVALSDGLISLDDPASKYVSEWKDHPAKSQITVRQLGSHTSGLDDAEEQGTPHDNLTGWKGDFWKRLDPPHDPFTIARDKTTVAFVPGTRIRYSNPAIAMMTYCVTQAIRSSDQKDIRSLLKQRVFKPIGIPDSDWSIGYGDAFHVDDLPLVPSWGGASFTPRATARVGRLLLHEGDWDSEQLLTKEAVHSVTGDAGLPGHCGMGFWTNADGRYPKLPRDLYYCAGANDQLLIVVPSLNLIAVRNGSALAPADENGKDVFAAYHDRRVQILFEPLIDAVEAQNQAR